MRAAFRWLRHTFELAGAVQLIVAFGSSAVVGGIAAGLLSISWPFRVVVFLGVASLVWAGVLALWQRRRRPRALSDQLDALLREGSVLLQELPGGAPVAEASTGYRVDLLPSPDFGECVDQFHERARALLLEQRPSLLPDYAEAANTFLERSRERRDRDRSSLDNAARLKDFADRAHRQPAVYLEACLQGLAAARNQLGH